MRPLKKLAVVTNTRMVKDYDDENIEYPLTMINVTVDGLFVKGDTDISVFLSPPSDYNRGWSSDYFLSCSCGCAGCAGYWDGIRIHMKKKTVSWTGYKRHGYTLGPVNSGEHVVWFDRKNYESIGKEILDLFKNNKDTLFSVFGGEYRGKEILNWLSQGE